MTFKAGRLAELLLDAQDISSLFNSAELTAKVATADTTTFKNQWKTFIVDTADFQFTASGYYDATAATMTAIRATLGTPNPSQTTASVLSYAPAGALAIGDFVRLISVVSSDYKEGSKIGGAVSLDWSVEGTAVGGYGVSLHPLAQEATGTITGTGDAINTAGTQTLTGAVGHLHVTQVSAATFSSFKFQDATTIGGAYTDITSGAFVNVTAVGAQRLVIPGTIRQFVRCVAVIGPATTTYAVSFART